jgi:hypothetical protein
MAVSHGALAAAAAAAQHHLADGQPLGGQPGSLEALRAAWNGAAHGALGGLYQPGFALPPALPFQQQQQQHFAAQHPRCAAASSRMSHSPALLL